MSMYMIFFPALVGEWSCS